MPKDFEILTDAEWRAYCKKRWTSLSFSFLFHAVFFSLFFGVFSLAIGTYYPAAQPYQKYIVGAVVVIVCATWAYLYYRRRKYYAKHYETPTSVSLTDPESGCIKTYNVVHLRYLNSPTVRLSFFRYCGNGVMDEVIFFYRRQILFVRDPETEEIYGYCPKCRELMEFKFIPYGVCPNCGKRFHFYDAH